MDVVEVRGVTRRFGSATALDGVSLSVEAGRVFGLLGPNGAGKTTLMRILTDILSPDSGEVLLFGSPDLRAASPRVGYMPEERGLYKGQTALDTVSYFARLRSMSDSAARSAALTALEEVGMAEHARKKLEELSKGMSQRVQFAATIAHRPELLILDEPLSGLDPVSALHLQRLIRTLRDEGRTILLSTHNMEHAENLCDGLIMLHRGQVRLSGGVSEVKERYSEGLLLIECAAPLPALPCAECTLQSPSRGILRVRDGFTRQSVVQELVAAGADIIRFEPCIPSLEDIFIRVAGAEGGQALRDTMANASMG